MKGSLNIVGFLWTMMSRNFVESGLLKSSDPLSFPLDGCDSASGWLEYEGHCYKLISPLDGGKPIYLIDEICLEEGPFKDGRGIAYLADVHSQAENDFIAEVVAGQNRAWLGAYRPADDWIWVIQDIRGNEDPGLSYTNWKPNEPNNHLNQEDCIEINRGPPGRWNDLNCRRKLPGVCEYSIAEWSTPSP